MMFTLINATQRVSTLTHVSIGKGHQYGNMNPYSPCYAGTLFHRTVKGMPEYSQLLFYHKRGNLQT